MRIITPTTIDQVAWEGNLTPLGGTFRGPETPARVTLGEPVWWSAEETMADDKGNSWKPPAGGQSYTLVRLACNLYPPSAARTQFAEATLTAFLRPRQGPHTVVAHDLFPQRVAVDQAGKFTVALDPQLKFAEAVDAKLLNVGVEIEYHKAFPVIQGFGLGESRPSWRFAHHAANPLLGCQSVYLVVAAPKAADGVRLAVELTATLETRWGPVRLALPDEARAHVSRLIGVPQHTGDTSHE